jgi:hypothetical protein
MGEPNKNIAQVIQDRNDLMNQLMDVNGTNVPTPTPSPVPQHRTWGQMLARLLGLGG